MKAVFTFSTDNDCIGRNGNFLDNEAFASSIVLSVRKAADNIGQVIVHTDPAGARLLSALDLPVDSIRETLRASGAHPCLWVLSKLDTYMRQQSAFVHIDLDAYLWEPLPAHVAAAPFVAQGSEENWPSYGPPLRYMLRHASYLPDFVLDHINEGRLEIPAYNAGIYGGNDVRGIKKCVQAAFDVVSHPGNRPMFEKLAAMHRTGNRIYENFAILLEQCFFGMYCHQQGKEVAVVVDESEHQYFTHLMAESKRNPDVVSRMKRRVLSDYPEHETRIKDWHKHCK